MTDERVAIFIDGSNLYHCLDQEFHHPKVDVEKFADKLRDGRRLVRTYYYTAAHKQADDPARYADQQKFFTRLKYIPYFEIKLGRLEKRPTGLVEKGVDLQLAVDMLVMALNDVYDTAVLVSGDGDFSYVVGHVKERGKHVENACTRTGHARALHEACDKFVLLDAGFMNGLLI